MGRGPSVASSWAAFEARSTSPAALRRPPVAVVRTRCAAVQEQPKMQGGEDGRSPGEPNKNAPAASRHRSAALLAPLTARPHTAHPLVRTLRRPAHPLRHLHHRAHLATSTKRNDLDLATARRNVKQSDNRHDGHARHEAAWAVVVPVPHVVLAVHRDPRRAPRRRRVGARRAGRAQLARVQVEPVRAVRRVCGAGECERASERARRRR